MSRLTPSLLVLFGLAVGCKDQTAPLARSPGRPEFGGLGGGGFDGSGESLQFPHWHVIPNFSVTGGSDQCFDPNYVPPPTRPLALSGLCSVGGVFLTNTFAGLATPSNPHEVGDVAEGQPSPSLAFGVASTAVHGTAADGTPLPSVAIKSGMQDFVGPGRAFSGKWILNFDYAFLTSAAATAPNLDVASARVLVGGSETNQVSALRVDKNNIQRADGSVIATPSSQTCGNADFSLCTGWLRAEFDITPYPNSILRILVEEALPKDNYASALAMDNFRIDPVFDAMGSEGATIQLTAPFSSSDFPTSSYAWSVTAGTAGCSLISSVADVATVRCSDNGSADVSLVMTPPPPGEISPVGGLLQVTNVPPTVGTVTTPIDPVAVNTSVVGSATFTDPGTADTYTGVFDWGDGTSSAAGVAQASGAGTASGAHTYTGAGVYTVRLTVTDDDGGSGSNQSGLLVVYDPSAAVAGLGWVNSPVVPSLPYMTAPGKAGFGFGSKYRQGSTVPVGVTGFAFQARNLVFSSARSEWLVIAGARAQLRGVGKINGAGDFGFLLTAIDGRAPGGGGVDRFRIKIWDRTNDVVVYDNQYGSADDADPTTALGGGDIAIFKQ